MTYSRTWSRNNCVMCVIDCTLYIDVFHYTAMHACRGVGCIFIEMLTGKPLFPGIKGVSDQLNKIWSVS